MNSDYLEGIMKLSKIDFQKMNTWRDIYNLPDLISDFRIGKWSMMPSAKQIASCLESTLLKCLTKSHLWSDDALNLYEAVEFNRDNLSLDIHEAVAQALSAIVSDVDQSILFEEDEITLETLRDNLPKIGNILGCATDAEVQLVQFRIEAIHEELSDEEDSAPEPVISRKYDSDQFSDNDIKALFGTLLT